MLLRLELLSSEHDVEKRFEAKSIEHVLPQNPDINSKWKKIFSESEHKKWVNEISNLVLLSKGKNSSASNLEFEEKKAEYLSKRVSDYPRSKYEQMLEFKIGERVSFQPDGYNLKIGILTRYNKKTVTIITEDGEHWNVSPSLIQKVKTIDTVGIEEKNVVQLFKK